jgi:hypothetical protein
MENTNAFKKGFNKVQNGDTKEVKKKIMEALSITVVSSWYNRLKGKIIPNIEEVKKIETIFSEYGISDIWGNK